MDQLSESSALDPEKASQLSSTSEQSHFLGREMCSAIHLCLYHPRTRMDVPPPETSNTPRSLDARCCLLGEFVSFGPVPRKFKF
jgi:hypothetical protein